MGRGNLNTDPVKIQGFRIKAELRERNDQKILIKAVIILADALLGDLQTIFSGNSREFRSEIIWIVQGLGTIALLILKKRRKDGFSISIK